MEEEKIFDYNLLWLQDRTPYLFDPSPDKKTLKGSLLNNIDSKKLKYNINKKSIFPDILQLSKYCVIQSFVPFKECQLNSYYSGPIIEFITTKENAGKLRDLPGKNFDFFSLDYKDLEMATEKESDIRTYEENMTYFKTSRTFLDKIILDQNTEFYKDTEILTYKDDIKDINRIFIPYKLNTTFSEDSIIDQSNYIFSDYYYKKKLVYFRTQVKQKLGFYIDLSNWSYCCFFNSNWCNYKLKEDFQLTQEKIKNIIYENFVNNNLITFNKSNYLIETNSYDKNYDVNRDTLFQLTELLKVQNYTNNEFKPDNMDNFSHLEKSFLYFPGGGYWVKYILYDGLNYKEDVIGPYTKEESLNKVKILKNDNRFKDYEPKSYAFYELVCENISEGKNLSSYVKEKNRWFCPVGVSIYCLIKEFKDIVYFRKSDITKSFQKYHYLALKNKLKYFESFDFIIYFNPSITISYKKAKDFRKYLSEQNSYSPEENVWILDEFDGIKYPRGNKPDVIIYETLEKVNKNNLNYERLMTIYNDVNLLSCDENKLQYSFDRIKSLIDSSYIDVYKTRSKKDLKFKYVINLLINNSEEPDKKINIIKNFDETFSIVLIKKRKNLDDIRLVEINQTSGCNGALNINFKNLNDYSYDLDKKDAFGYDSYFDSKTILVIFILFLSKCFGFEIISLDTRLKKTFCDKNIKLNEFDIDFLSDQDIDFLILSGFVAENQDEYFDIINKYKSLTVIEYVRGKGFKIRLTDEIKNKTIEEFCNDYKNLEKCPKKNILLILSNLSEDIQTSTSMKIFNDLREKNFDFFLEYI